MGDWKRSDACAALGAADEGREVILTGWVHRRRDHGGLVFMDLRDRSGLCQVVVDGEAESLRESLRPVRSEWVLAVRGTVRLRPADMRNAELPSGDVEVLVAELRVLNSSLTPPFPIDSFQESEVSDDLRLKYRYLDLRRREMLARMEFRHRVTLAVREFLSGEGFLEIETPLLIRSTPEGARDYVVPSRLQPGHFYALPQSPQLYKQLLMVAGYEKYFQIARCLRDEDLRGDRQPEHTQIDMEMSFATEDMVFDVVERLLGSIFRGVMGRELETPFLRLSYREAMDRFGSDKPDLRFALELTDLGDVAARSSFQAFKGVLEAGGSVKGLRVPGGASFSRKDIEALEGAAKTYRAKGLAWMKRGAEGLSGGVAKFFEGETGEALIRAAGLEEGDLLLMVADQGEVPCIAMGAVRSALGAKLGLTAGGEFRFLWVHRFPMFEQDEETGNWEAMHHLFTMPAPEDLEFLESDPGRVHGQLYDLVCNGVELASGSIRIHRRDIQERVMAVVGIDKDEAERRFGFLLGAFDYGAPPHGGIAPGMDRLLMVLDGGQSIRDYIAFPKTLQGKSLMVGSPAPLDSRQLEELHLRVMERKD
ncbi:MAG: aspartate--tRNA ligase [Candidatus Latescibacteria bacterium]|nr:aspartate--tRNA ligase [bacterium]MCB9516803.1 aspartate--tRNA ligase [Candidatus Latescibacterota bacterium]